MARNRDAAGLRGSGAHDGGRSACFVIAHRLSTIRDANLIVVMEEGRIVEQGSHEALLESRGAYFRLYNSQFVGAEI